MVSAAVPVSDLTLSAAGFSLTTQGSWGNQTGAAFEAGLESGASSRNITINLTFNASARIGAASLQVAGRMEAPTCATVLGRAGVGGFGEGAGSVVKGAGDLNADGLPDIAYTVPIRDFTSTRDPRVEVLYGTREADWATGPNWTYTDPEGDDVGAGLTSGDYAGDSTNDLVVTVSAGSSVGNPAILIFQGSVGGLAASPTVELEWTGNGSTGWGVEVAGGIDLNGDLWQDLVVGEPSYVGALGVGRLVILWGSSGGLDLSNFTVVEEPGSFQLGSLLTPLGDTDGDGLGEFFAGTFRNGSRKGSGHVFEGVSGVRQVELTWARTSTLVESFGFSAAGGNDLTGDGVPDLVVGAPDTGINRGSAYVFRGLGSATYEGDPWFTFLPETSADEQFGVGVAILPDIDGDAVAEIAVGGNGLHSGDGRVYLFLGGARNGTLAQTMDAQYPGENANLGWSVVAPGDMNGDGAADLVAGAPALSNGSTRGGGVRVYFIRPNSFPENVSVSVGDARAWSLVGRLVGPETVSTLRGALQSYIEANASQALAGELLVPLHIRFDRGGVLNLSQFSIVSSVLLAPRGVTAIAAAQGGRVLLSWAPQVSDATEVVVWSNKSGGAFEAIGAVAAVTNAFEDSNVTDGQRYWYFLTEEEAAAGTRSGPSAIVSSVPSDAVPPAPPGGAAATLDAPNHTVILRWVPNSDDTVSYQVWKRIGANGTFAFREQLPALASRFDDGGLVEDQEYAYILRAVDDAGLISAPSAAVVVHMPDLFPPAVDFFMPTEWPDNLVLPLSAENVTDDDARWGNGDDATYEWTVAGPGLNPALVVFGRAATIGPFLPGSFVVTLRVWDAAGLNDSRSRPLTVADRTPPRVEVAGAGFYNEGDTVRLDAAASSDSNPAGSLTYSWSLSYGGQSATASTPAVTVAAVPYGLFTAIITVTDAEGNPSSRVVAFQVNDVPDLRVAVQPGYPAGQLITIPVLVIDRDESDSHSFTPPPTIQGSAVNSAGVFSWVPGAGSYGLYFAEIRVSDGHANATARFILNVTRPASANNHPPAFVVLPLAGVVPGSLFEGSAQASDADSDKVTMAVLDAPASLEWNTTGGLSLRWAVPASTPENATFNLRLVASDGIALTTATITLRARSNNEAPQIHPRLIADSLVLREGSLVQLSIPFGNFSDPDDPSGLIIVATSDDPTRVSVESRLGPGDVPELVITAKAQGQANITVRVVDPSGASASQVVPVTVGAALPVAASGAIPGEIVLGASLAAGAVMLGLAARRRRPEEEVAPSSPAGAAAASAAVAAAAVAAKRPMGSSYLVDTVLLLYKDGRNMFWHVRPHSGAEDDPASLGPMFVAIQDFVREALRKEEDVRELSYGEDTILIERGSYVILATTVFGEPPAEMRETMGSAVRKVEANFAGIIEDWDGNKSRLPGVEAMLEPIWLATQNATREEVVLATRPREVQVLSGLEFYQGYLRLKVGVVNSTLSVVTNATLDLDFDRDVLALDRVEPVTYRTEGAKVHLGVIHTGERKTVAYYFDPLICTSSAIDGTCRFRDSGGEARVSQMKRRVAEVVCPLFFTQEVANTAMLKRLVEAELQQFDVKAYEMAAGALEGAARGLFAEMKQAVLAHDVRLIREHSEEGAEALDAWFYGKTKVTEDEFVIRAAVFPARGRAEFYAASSSMSKVTGLLAELNRQLTEGAEAGALGGLETTDEGASRRAYADPAAVWAMLGDESEEETG